MFKRVWTYLIIILIVRGLTITINILPKLFPIPAEQLILAQQGVIENAAWQPLIRRIKGVDMVLVPAGCFNMGSTDEQLEEASNPGH
jgi:hypothetical protein